MICESTSRRTRRAIVFGAILKEPFICIFMLLPFILLKEFGALFVQIAILKSLLPASSFVSFYLSELVSRNFITLKNFLLCSGVIGRIGFIPALLTDNVYLYILGSTIYMICMRAEMPAWMEVIKKNIYKSQWEGSFSTGSIISYSSGILFTLLFSSLLYQNPSLWKTLFCCSLFFSTIAVFIQVSHIDNDLQVKKFAVNIKSSFSQPIKDSISLLKDNEEFRRFQWAFMIGGMGLMVINAIIPFHFTKNLHLDYASLCITFGVCKSLGFIFATPLWNRLLSRLSCRTFVFIVLLGFSLFCFALIFTSYSLYMVFVAFGIYGVAQAGSHLVWHLSGPLFSNDEGSSRYSGVNVVMIGIRGLIGPFLGMQLLFWFSAPTIFFLCMLLTASGGTYYFLNNKVRVKKNLRRV